MRISKTKVAYLGHLIIKDGVQPNPSKVENFPQPKNSKEIISRISRILSEIHSELCKVSKLLTKLLQKDIPFNFNSNCIVSLNSLKKVLIIKAILIYPNFEEPLTLTTDASSFATIGSVLSQDPAETGYGTIERELLSIVWYVKHFAPYLYGRKFKLITDHHPLTWILSIKHPGSRLANWTLKLEEYDYEIIDKPGKYNKNADELSG